MNLSTYVSAGDFYSVGIMHVHGNKSNRTEIRKDVPGMYNG